MDTVSIAMLAFISCCFTTCKSDELELLSDNAVQDKILSDAVFEVFSKTTLLQCRRLCLYSSRCVSANWITGAKECQLNSRSSDEQSLQESPTNIYLAIHVNSLQAHPCSDHPCTVDDVCVPVTGSTSHICLRTDSSDQGVSTVSSVISITTAGNPEVSSEASTTRTDQVIIQPNDTSTTANNNHFQTSDTSTTTNNNLVQTSDISTTANNTLIQETRTSTTANNNLIQATDTSTTANNNLVQANDTSTTNNTPVQETSTSTTANNNLVQTSDITTTANNNLGQASNTSTIANNNLGQASDTSTTANNNMFQSSDTSITANDNLFQGSDTSVTTGNNLFQTSVSSNTATADGSCSGDAECAAFPSTKCRVGFCTCNIGYDLDVARAVCRDLRECTNFGTEYTHFPGQVIWKEDVESNSRSYPVAKCVQLCNEASTYVCKTFEIDTKFNGCYTQTVTWLDVTEDKYWYSDRFDQYQRKCNWEII